MAERWRSAHLDDLDAIPGPGTLTWHPVRAALDVRAFGCNAYSAQDVGDDVVEPHDEGGADGHQELYFVARGRATFTLDDETLDAPAGTYVFIPDGSVHRHAVAAQPGTTVLSFGGPAGFEPSAWEWYFRADPLIESDPERARAIIEDGLATHRDSPGLHLRLARVEIRAGDEQAARAALRTALDLDPRAEEVARRDALLDPLV
jgi:hypothetical protein